eukprot:7131883-Karenia_brevis.AAC.1
MSVAYVDDVFKPVLCHASDIVAHVQTLAQISMRTFLRFGFQPNFAQGKSEVLLSFAGPQSRDVKHHIMNNMSSCIHTVVSVNSTVYNIDVRCIDMYKHLGTQMLSGMSILPLIKMRFAAAKPSMQA